MQISIVHVQVYDVFKMKLFELAILHIGSKQVRAEILVNHDKTPYLAIFEFLVAFVESGVSFLNERFFQIIWVYLLLSIFIEIKDYFYDTLLVHLIDNFLTQIEFK